MQEESFSEAWDDLFVQFPINSKKEADQLVGILDEARIDRFSMQATFQEEYERLEFDNELHLQQDGEEDTKSHVKQKLRQFFRKPEGYPYESIMDLGRHEVHSKIFVHVYAEQIKRMEVENSYRFFTDRSRLRIFMKQSNQLNMLCKHKLYEMRNQLCVMHSYDQQLLTILRTSKKLRDNLLQNGVSSWFRWHQRKEMGYFFSRTLKFGEIQIFVQEVARFNTTIFNFFHKSLTKIERISVFQLLKEGISDVVTLLEEEYQIEIEFSDEWQCIIIHSKHVCFGREVQEHLRRAINKLVILSIKSKEIRQFNNRIRKELKILPFLKERMKGSRQETFLVINLNLLSPKGVPNIKYLQDFLKFFKIVVDKDLLVKVFFNHISRNQVNKETQVNKEIQRVTQLAQDKKFILKNENLLLLDGKQMKGIFALKDFSQAILVKRQKQLIQFIKELVVPQSKDRQQMSSMVDSFFQEGSQTGSSLSHQSDWQTQKLSKLEDQGRIPWFKYPFQMPPLREIEEEDRAFILGKKRRDLIKLFQDNCKLKFNIFGLELATKMAWPTQVQEHPMLIRKPFNGIFFNEGFEFCSLSALKQDQQGFIVFFNKSLKSDFVPVLVLKRIAE